MADGKIKISELGQALQLNDDAFFPYTQDNGGVPTTFKAPANQIARKVAEGSTFTNLETTSKTLVGAINELSHLGNPILLGTTAPTSSQGADGNIYVQYTEGTGGASDTVDSIYAKIDGAWCEIETGGGGGSGGHTIVDDSGTALTQRTNLQFNGAYSEDNSTDDTTEVNVVREMTKAEFDELTEEEKTGLINITDITGGNDDRFQPVIYSEDEREIGVWTDGKPLYEKTFTSTTIVGFNSDTEMVLNDSIPTGAEIKSIWGMLDLTLPNAHYVANSTNWFKYYFNVLTKQIFASQSLASATPTSTLAVFTIQYTKTTDTPGSGQWTPQGVPSHHYLTDEQVVGTWIDGSTIYEKTFELSARTSVKNDYTTIIISDTTTYAINNIIDCVYYDNNGGSDLSAIRALPTNIETYLSANNTLIAYYNTDNVYKITKFTIRYTKSST